MRIYKPDGNYNGPNTDILTENVVVSAPAGGQWYTVDLTPYNVQAPEEGFFVAMEWIVSGDKFYTTNFMAEYSPYGQILRPTFEFKDSRTWSYAIGRGWNLVTLANGGECCCTVLANQASRPEVGDRSDQNASEVSPAQRPGRFLVTGAARPIGDERAADHENGRWDQPQQEVIERHQAADQVKLVAERLCETVRLGRAVSRCLMLGRQVEAQMGEVNGSGAKKGDHRAMVRASNSLLQLRQLFYANEPGEEGHGLERVNVVTLLRSDLVQVSERNLIAKAQQVVKV